MLYRRSRTESPRASPFVVLSSMEMTLLTVVYAGPQTALDLPGCLGTYQFASKAANRKHFKPPSMSKRQHQSLAGGTSAFRLRVIAWNDKPRFASLSALSCRVSLILGLSFIAL